MDGVTIMTDSTTYHVGDYTYEEIFKWSDYGYGSWMVRTRNHE